MNWREAVLADVRRMLAAQTAEGKLEACQALLDTVEEQLDLSRIQGARALAEKLKGKIHETHQ